MGLGDDVSPLIQRDGLALVPVGSVEQHGAHLPLNTDTVIASAVADALAPLLGARVTPAIAFGSSGEHQSFAGTISIGTEVLTAVLIEVGRSISEWAARIIFVNGHGGNVAALTAAVSRLRFEGRDVAWVPCAPRGTDLHAGHGETSLMLHLSPHRVRMAAAQRGTTAPLSDLLPLMQAGGVAAVAPNGVLGDPTRANAEEGRRLLAEMTADAYHQVHLGVMR